MSEAYRENVAAKEREGGKINYPIIVVYDGNIDYDTTRFYNDVTQSEMYPEKNANGVDVLYRDIKGPLMPYNLNYRIEIICEKRIQLDAILLWILKYVPDRGILDVQYKDENNNDAVYESILKRGNIIKADESTSSTLYRRIFELRLTTLLEGALISKVVVAERVNITEKE